MKKIVFLSVLLMLTLCSVVKADYLLGAGDLVKIVVYDEPELSIEAQVDSVGVVSYPFIGSLSMKGKSVSEVKSQIILGLKGDYLINPEVTVTIIQYRQFFVNGRVKKPGAFAYQPGITVQKSISLAGGFDTRANKEDLSITSGESGEIRDVVPETLVRPGDVISVERSFF